MRHSTWLLLLALLAPPSALGAQTIQNATLRRAQQAFDNLEYRQALSLGQASLRERLNGYDRARAYELLGFTYSGMDSILKAVDAFKQVVLLEPERDLDPNRTSPKALSAFQVALTQILVIRQLRVDSVSFIGGQGAVPIRYTVTQPSRVVMRITGGTLGNMRIDSTVATGQVNIRWPARLPSGEPNLAGDWAQEQLVMTDPKGLNGTLVPLSQVGKYTPGAVPEGQREIPGARGTAEANAGGLPLNRPAPRAAVALTDAGQAAMEKLAALPRAQRSCTQGSIVSDWGGEGVNRITQAADTIKLQYGRLGLERTIYINAAHPANVAPSRAGHSTAKWENDVLVVDTVGFLPGTLTGTTPHSDKLHVVERFTLDATATTLKREYTAEDPLYFTAQYKGSDTVAPSNVPYAPEVCADLTPTGAPSAAR